MKVEKIIILIRDKWKQLREKFTREVILNVIKNEIAATLLTMLIIPVIFFTVGVVILIFSPIMVIVYPIVGNVIVSIAPPSILLDFIDGCKNVLETFIDNNWLNYVTSIISSVSFYLERLIKWIIRLIELAGERFGVICGFVEVIISRIPDRKKFQAIKKTVGKIIKKLKNVR